MLQKGHLLSYERLVPFRVCLHKIFSSCNLYLCLLRACVCVGVIKREREIKRKAVVSRDVTLWVVWLFHFGSAARFEWWWWGGVMQFFPTAVWCRNVLRQRLLRLWGYGIVSRVWWCAHTHALVAGSYPLILLQCVLTAGGRL